MANIKIIQYKWEGHWGPFRIKTRCGECDLTTAILKSVMKKEFKKKKISLKVIPWLNNWYKIIWKGGWHAPIVVVNGRVLDQGKTIDRNMLVARIKEALKK